MTYQQSQDILRQQTQQNTHNLYHANLEDIISERIYNFFPDGVLTYFPIDGVKHILSSELIYYHMLHSSNIDGVGVLIGYQKILDSMIELYVTQKFRAYIKNSHTKILDPKNTPLEKSLHKVIDKKYSLSLGRLYQLLEKLSKNTPSEYYENIFSEFLMGQKNLKNTLLDPKFLLQLESLIAKDVTGEKRHTGFVSLNETKHVRDLYIGNFQNTDCLIYSLASTQNFNF